ncbi:FRG domain-containing protein [Mucilaginibacter sp. PAMB04274]|uniref:FRG domain-containing protein n=1 Tax=Mucilaginibacter sp. PAMB04274 TaxID=3138568 RepID=UPI0031F6A9B8
MNTLSQTIENLVLRYPQELIPLKYFDNSTLTSPIVPQPKYFFRGERSAKWETSKSTYSRNLHGKPIFEEVNYLVTGIHLPTLEIINNYSLYLFLREALWNISIVDRKKQHPKIEESIAGLMQHYGFDTGFVDVTSDLLVAAHFAACGVPGDIGQIMVLETQNVADQYFDLTTLFGNRPKLQSSFVLSGTNELDLKSNEFAIDYKPKWYQFELTEYDRNRFINPELLSSSNDEVIPEIISWYDSHIANNDAISFEVKTYLTGKINALTS